MGCVLLGVYCIALQFLRLIFLKDADCKSLAIVLKNLYRRLCNVKGRGLFQMNVIFGKTLWSLGWELENEGRATLRNSFRPFMGCSLNPIVQLGVQNVQKSFFSCLGLLLPQSSTGFPSVWKKEKQNSLWHERILISGLVLTYIDQVGSWNQGIANIFVDIFVF